MIGQNSKVILYDTELHFKVTEIDGKFDDSSNNILQNILFVVDVKINRQYYFLL